MKEKHYDYVFTHTKTKAKLKFSSTSIEEATQVLSIMVVSIADWDMKRFKCK